MLINLQSRRVYKKEPEKLGFVASIISGVVAVGTTVASAVIKKKQAEKAQKVQLNLQRAQQLAASKQVAAINAINKQTASIVASQAPENKVTSQKSSIDLKTVLTYGVPIAILGITLLKNKKSSSKRKK